MGFLVLLTLEAFTIVTDQTSNAEQSSKNSGFYKYDVKER